LQLAAALKGAKSMKVGKPLTQGQIRRAVETITHKARLFSFKRGVGLLEFPAGGLMFNIDGQTLDVTAQAT
jgi:hypothetical protein